jgi:primosomal protein N' (replication factor Y)
MSGSSDIFAVFAVAHATAHELTYQVPVEWAEQLQAGRLCRLPVQGRLLIGVFLRWCDKPAFACRAIAGFVEHCPPLKTRILELLEWVSHYYLSPMGRTIHLAGPGFLWSVEAQSKRLKRLEKNHQTIVETSRNKRKPRTMPAAGPASDSLAQAHSSAPLKTLNTEQQSAYLQIAASAAGHTTLLQGVTGSGKTEVYLHLVAETLRHGQSALILLPEIALTPQMCERFRVHFPTELAVLHSGLTSVAYEREWFRVANNQARVVLGVRSAVFAPLEQLGLIVVDEEHEQSYKCDEFPCYHARDVAVKRAHLEGARCVLGSATPSLESYFNVQRKRYSIVHLQAKHSRQTNQMDIFQFRPQLHSTGGLNRGVVRSSQFAFSGQVIAPGVIERLAQTHAKGEQSMVIINRRGFAQFALCTDCGEALRCPHCSVSTTLHAKGARELCHYCGFSRSTLTVCPGCGSSNLVQMGLGTQNLEQEIAERVPGLVVDRLDRDVLTSQTRLASILSKFKTGETECLVGTQMLSKGHDFPRVTLVVVLNVEDGLFIPDYRASERTFQLLCQAAGRSGRGHLSGFVAVQSLGASHPVIHRALKGDVDLFLQDELKMRELGWHPPVSRQILIELHHSNESLLMHKAMAIQKELTHLWTSQSLSPQDVRLTGPMPASLSKLKGSYRVHLVIAARKDIHPSRLVPVELTSRKEFHSIIKVDVDPFSFL